jgi:hypothetical protein
MHRNQEKIMPEEKGYYTDQVKIYVPGGMFDNSAFNPNQSSNETSLFITELSPSESLYNHNVEYIYEENEETDCYDLCHQIFTAIAFVAICGNAVYYALNIIEEYQGFDQFDHR